jgi:hypothetical protein
VIDDQEFVFSNNWGLCGDERACDRSCASEYELRAINLMNQIGIREPCSDSSSEDDDEPDFQQALAWMDAHTLDRAYAIRHRLQRAQLRLLTGHEAITTVPIPRSAAEAVYDPIYGECWMSAMANELEKKHRADYTFMCRRTIPEGLLVLHGSWIFSTKADMFSASIIFNARWVEEGYNTILSTTYMSTFTDIGLITIDVEYEPVVFCGPSWFNTTPLPHTTPVAPDGRCRTPKIFWTL